MSGWIITRPGYDVRPAGTTIRTGPPVHGGERLGRVGTDTSVSPGDEVEGGADRIDRRPRAAQWTRDPPQDQTPSYRQPEGQVDKDRARALIQAQRSELRTLLTDLDVVGRQNRSTENETGDPSDRAQPLSAEGVDDAVGAGVRDRLAALDRADQRLENGTFGRSIRSGLPIPDERLESDPAAELTVEEARQR